MKYFLITLLIAAAFAQGPPEDAVENSIGVGGEGVVFTSTWPQNSERLAGAVGTIAFAGNHESECTISFLYPVELFHPYDFYFIANSYTGSQEYKISPAYWAANNTEFGFLINFSNGTDGLPLAFNASDVTFSCSAPASPFDIGVYSTSSDMDQMHQQLQIYYRPGFHINDVVLVSFPSPVVNFTLATRLNGTTVEPNTDEPNQLFTISEFAHNPAEGEYRVDDQKIIFAHFSFVDSENRFTADQVDVSVLGSGNTEEP